MEFLGTSLLLMTAQWVKCYQHKLEGYTEKLLCNENWLLGLDSGGALTLPDSQCSETTD